jgi:FkbM family methyltransferase
MVVAQFFSQFGEDRVLHDLFDGKNTGCCVEIGGNDGVLNSNSLHFELLGWKTIVIEPIPALCTAIRARRPGAVVIECAASDRQGSCDFHIAIGVDGMSSMEDDACHREDIRSEGGRIETITVPMRTLDDVLAGEAVTAIDFMTIDVEGAEMRVLAGLSLERWKPRILIVEDNSHGSDPTIVGYLRTRGYENFHRTGVNDWFAVAGDHEVLGRFDRVAFSRLRAWLPWRYRAGRFARAILPAFVRAGLKQLFGQIPFSPSDGR